MTVDELHSRMSAQEFGEWMAYWKLEPWGAWRDNWHMAGLQALLFNVHKSKVAPQKTRTDFMYEDNEVTVERKAKTFAAKLRAMATRKK